MQGLSYEFETEGATCYIELALRVPVSAKNLKIHGCQRWCSEFRRVPGTCGTRANSSPVYAIACRDKWDAACALGTLQSKWPHWNLFCCHFEICIFLVIDKFLTDVLSYSLLPALSSFTSVFGRFTAVEEVLIIQNFFVKFFGSRMFIRS